MLTKKDNQMTVMVVFFMLYKKVRSIKHKTLRGIALRRQGICRFRDPPKAKNLASEILYSYDLFIMQYC